jgi:hypothetical protein
MITGEAFEVHDGQLNEACLCKCTAGHIFKDDFLIPWEPEYPEREEMVAKLEENIDSKRECEKIRALPLPQLKSRYASEFLGGEDGGYEVNVNACPICTMTNVTDGDLIKFMLKQTKITRTELVKTIKKDFGNYETFQRFINK